jgi:hypothetical protein
MGLGSGIRKKPIPDPGSRGQKGTGSRIRIRNTARPGIEPGLPASLHSNKELFKQLMLLLFGTSVSSVSKFYANCLHSRIKCALSLIKISTGIILNFL